MSTVVLTKERKQITTILFVSVSLAFMLTLGVACRVMYVGMTRLCFSVVQVSKYISTLELSENILGLETKQ